MTIRSSGILLHITSLPSPYGIGDMGPEAYRFADFLAQSGQRYWQVLPLNPVDPVHSGSPYHSHSAFAGNPLLISPEFLVQEDLLKAEDLKDRPRFSDQAVDFHAVFDYRAILFERAFRHFQERTRPPEYERFRKTHAHWLNDYALFEALKTRYPNQSWRDWPQPIRDREASAMEAARHELADIVEREIFLQFVFMDQWIRLKTYCNQRNIHLFGDMPIYMPFDSVDVWAHPDQFQLDENRKPYAVSGVPPDYFSETGQLWGHPLYRWDAMRNNGYDWWMRRVRHNLILFDLVRIDHFRGLAAYWSVPAGEETALNGQWVQGPGDDLFKQLARKFPSLPIVAEDLGTITADVRELIQKFNLPGMRLLLFAFGGDFPSGAYLPHNLERNCIVYTGTHDNNTARGWYEEESSDSDKHHLFQYLGRHISADEVAWELIRLAMMSSANTAILPIQDVLGLPGEARMNRPAGGGVNWGWRMAPGALTHEVAQRLHTATWTYGRL